MRICLLGLPRCGSQYISSLIISNTDYKIKNLSEPFTPRHEASLNDIGFTITDFNSYEEQVSLVIDRIKSFNSGQSLVMKLFLHSTIPLINHIRIIEALRELNFKFVIIKRKNTVDQLLSLGIGLKVNKFSNFGSYDNSIVEIDDYILSIMKTLQDDLEKFDGLINELNLSDSPTLYYETINQDLSAFLGKNIKINSGYRRMSILPSKYRISNIDKVLTSLNIS